MARPKIYSDASERQAAFRATKTRIDLTVDNSLGETLENIGYRLGITKNALVNAMIRHSLTTHNWKMAGLWIKK